MWRGRGVDLLFSVLTYPIDLGLHVLYRLVRVWEGVVACIKWGVVCTCARRCLQGEPRMRIPLAASGERRNFLAPTATD